MSRRTVASAIDNFETAASSRDWASRILSIATLSRISALAVRLRRTSAYTASPIADTPVMPADTSEMTAPASTT